MPVERNSELKAMKPKFPLRLTHATGIFWASYFIIPGLSILIQNIRDKMLLQQNLPHSEFDSMKYPSPVKLSQVVHYKCFVIYNLVFILQCELLMFLFNE